MTSYPQPLDLPDDVIVALGSFWTARDRDPVLRNLITSRQLQDRYQLGLLDDYRNSYSRQKCPLLRRREGMLVRFRESERSLIDSLYHYGDAGLFYNGQKTYGQINTDYYAWSLPPGMIDVAFVVDRLYVSTVSWTGGIDYEVRDNRLIFQFNPFGQANLPFNEILDDDGNVTDRELWVWLYGCSYELDYLYKFFGFAIGLPTKSTVVARNAVNGVYDAITKTNFLTNTVRLLGSITDTPYAYEDGEVVEHVFYDTSYLWIVTDKKSYRASHNAVPLVAEGDVLKINAALTDASSIHSLRRGVLPFEIPALSIQEEWFDIAVPQPATLSDDEVAVTATPNSETGFLEVRFPIFANDDWFWEEVRQREISQGLSLAKQMLGLTAEDPEPAAGNLPATIQPMSWFVHNFLRNAYLVVVHTSKLGPDAIHLSALSRLRHASAPHIWYVVLIIADVDLPAYELPSSEADTLDIAVIDVDAYELPAIVVTVEATGESCR